MTELKDKRLEAAAQLHAYIGDRNIEKFRVFYPNNQDFARDVVNFALRVTGADELAQIVEMLVSFAQDAPKLDYNEDKTLSWIAVICSQSMTALAHYKELKNG